MLNLSLKGWSLCIHVIILDAVTQHIYVWVHKQRMFTTLLTRADMTLCHGGKGRLSPTQNFSVLYLLITMFTIQYWHESSMTWRGTGSGTFYDKSHAIQRMRAMSEMTDFSVRFRVTAQVVTA